MSGVAVCPVDCIRPVEGSAEFTKTEILYIDQQSCIDCGAGFDGCPVDAIRYDEDLPEPLLRFRSFRN